MSINVHSLLWGIQQKQKRQPGRPETCINILFFLQKNKIKERKKSLGGKYFFHLCAKFGWLTPDHVGDICRQRDTCIIVGLNIKS